MKIKKMFASLAAASMLCSMVSATALNAFAYTFSKNDIPLDQRECVVVPEEFNGETVTSISTLGLALMSMKELTLPGTLTSFGLECCKCNYSLEKLTLSEGLTYLGSSMFIGCTKLPRVDMPASMETIGNECFAGCSALEEVHLSNHVEKIEACAFADTALSTISFPSSLYAIGDHAFIGCNNMHSVIIPARVSKIGEQAFGYYRKDEPASPMIVYPWLYSDYYEKADDFTIYGYTGTAAEEYAEENEFNFVALDTEINMRGDADGNNVINAKDAVKVLQFAADYLVNPSVEVTAQNISMVSAADIDGDGEITAADAQYILMYFMYNSVMELPTTWEQLLAAE